jgi:hypothetical protein
MKRVLLVLCVAVLSVSVIPTQAVVFIDGPWEGESWRARFGEGWGLTFDFLRVDWQSGNKFEPAVFRNFSHDDGSWGPVWDYDYSAAYAGNADTYIEWDWHFAGSSSQPVHFKYAAYHNGVLQLAQYVHWNPGWDYPVIHDWDPGLNPPPPIPEPASILTLGLGLIVGAGVYRRRRKV